MTRDWDAEQREAETERAESFADMRRSTKVRVAPSEGEPALPPEVQRHENAKEAVRRLRQDRDNATTDGGTEC